MRTSVGFGKLLGLQRSGHCGALLAGVARSEPEHGAGASKHHDAAVYASASAVKKTQRSARP
jgi:hypothetical protein